MSNPDQSPAYWARKDGMKAMSDDEKQGWIESGNSDIADDYSIPLYASCQICSGHGVVGHAPDGYYPCPECTSAQAPVAGQPAEPSPAHSELLAELHLLEQVCAIYANDEDRYNNGQGEPFGSVPVQVGFKARAARDRAMKRLAAPKGDSNG